MTGTQEEEQMVMVRAWQLRGLLGCARGLARMLDERAARMEARMMGSPELARELDSLSKADRDAGLEIRALMESASGVLISVSP